MLPAGPQVSIRCAVTIATCMSSPGSGCREVKVWATEGERYSVAWNQRSWLCTGAFQLPQELGSRVLSQRNLTLLVDSRAEMSGTGRPRRGALPQASPGKMGQWVSPGLEARESWVQILHPYLLLRSPWDHHLTLGAQHPQVERGRVIFLHLTSRGGCRDQRYQL